MAISTVGRLKSLSPFSSHLRCQVKLARCNVLDAPRVFLRFGLFPSHVSLHSKSIANSLVLWPYPSHSGVFRCLTAPFPAIIVTRKVAHFHPCSAAISQPKKHRSRPNHASAGWYNLLRRNWDGCFALTLLKCDVIQTRQKSLI